MPHFKVGKSSGNERIINVSVKNHRFAKTAEYRNVFRFLIPKLNVSFLQVQKNDI